jgi:hypothetical protein
MEQEAHHSDHPAAPCSTVPSAATRLEPCASEGSELRARPSELLCICGAEWECGQHGWELVASAAQPAEETIYTRRVAELLAKVPLPPKAITVEAGGALLDELQSIARAISDDIAARAAIERATS